jgi:hypothetical protein
LKKDNRRVSVSGKRTILTYGYLHSAADMMLEQAESSEEGRFYSCLCSIVMNAFCFEAYLNHVGVMKYPRWDDTLSPLDKLDLICNRERIVNDMSKRPFQSMKLVNQFRNDLAHAHTEELKIAYQEDFKPVQKVKYPKVIWEKQCNVKNAKIYFDDLEVVINTIHAALGLGKSAFGILGYAGVGSKLEQRQ